MPQPARIVVVGSINMDLVARVARLPNPGETVPARDLQFIPGGKGANQAVAAARMGAHITMIGRVGDDPFGQSLRNGLRAENINCDLVHVVTNCASGLAWIGVGDDGNNAITVVPGANGRLTPQDIDACEAVIAAADAVLLQLEIPLETAARAAELARRHRVSVILDSAPVPSQALPAALWTVNVLSPNQTEAESLTGIRVDSIPAAYQAAKVLRSRGAQQVVIKLGELGAVWLDENKHLGHVPARKIQPVDTTAAGDAFTSAMTVALAEGQPLPMAVQWGCAAGTLAALKPGAQPAMPTRREVEAALSQNERP